MAGKKPDGRICPHCGSDLSRLGAAYAIFWVPTRSVGYLDSEGDLCLPGWTPGERLWDWDGDDGPARRSYACGECGGEIEVGVKWSR